MPQRLLISMIVVAVPGGFAYIARIEADPPKTTGKSLQASDEFVRLDADVTQAISQGDTEGCGPVSLLNLLKLGPESHKKAYKKLTRGDDSLALKLLVEKYCSPNGAEGKVRYSNRTGIDDPNLTRLCTAVATDFELPTPQCPSCGNRSPLRQIGREHLQANAQRRAQSLRPSLS